MCESRGGRPGLLVPSSRYGLGGRKATLNEPIQTEPDFYSGRTRAMFPGTLRRYVAFRVF